MPQEPDLPLQMRLGHVTPPSMPSVRTRSPTRCVLRTGDMWGWLPGVRGPEKVAASWDTVGSAWLQGTGVLETTVLSGRL